MPDRVYLVWKILIEYTPKPRVSMAHTYGILVFVLFVLVCSPLCRDDTLFTEGNEEQVLAAMVCAVVVRRLVCFSVSPLSR